MLNDKWIDTIRETERKSTQRISNGYQSAPVAPVGKPIVDNNSNHRVPMQPSPPTSHRISVQPQTVDTIKPTAPSSLPLNGFGHTDSAVTVSS